MKKIIVYRVMVEFVVNSIVHREEVLVDGAHNETYAISRALAYVRDRYVNSRFVVALWAKKFTY